MTDFLEQVVAERRAYARGARLRVSESSLLAELRHNAWTRSHPSHAPGRPVRDGDMDAFGHALMQRKRAGQLAVVAEVKRVSPAHGRLAPAGLSAAEQALLYAAAGATAISVLTEPRHWGGAIEDLAAVRDAVELPVLCKDVIVDEYQIVEARAAGADAVLLVAEALSDEELRRFVGRSQALSMGALVEAHDPVAFGRAVACGGVVVGVNARNLRQPTEIDVGRARQLHTFVKEHQVLVAESGIRTVDDVRLLPARVDAVLVGSALMSAEDPGPLIHGIASIRKRPQVEVMVAEDL